MSAYVDRWRVVREAPQPRRVDGSTITATILGDWARGRLTIGQSREVAGPGGAVRTELGAELRVGPTADIVASDRVEIDAGGAGRERWRVVGQPRPLRATRRVVALVVELARVVDGA